jgi:signal transduction histidine kinase
MSGRREQPADEAALLRVARRIGTQVAVGVVVLVVGLAGIIVLVVLRGQQHADDALVATAIEHPGNLADPPMGVWVVIWHGNDEAATPGLPLGLPDLGQIDAVSIDRTGRSADFSAHQHKYLVKTEPLAGDGVVQALLDLGGDRVERARLVMGLLVSGIVGLAVAAAGGVWLTRRVVAPLATARTMRRRLVVDAGAELRTPLALLGSRARLIRGSLGPDTDVETVRADIDGLADEAQHLADVLDGLVLAVDPSQAPADELVVLPAVVASVVADAAQLAEQHGIRLMVDTEGEPPAVLGAPAALRRAVAALVDNAIRQAESVVAVTTVSVGEDVVVDVSDDGLGVEPDALPTLLPPPDTSGDSRLGRQPGRRGVRRRYDPVLAVVGDIAVRHGGVVSVVYTGRPGATLRLRLPAAPRP